MLILQLTVTAGAFLCALLHILKHDKKRSTAMRGWRSAKDERLHMPMSAHSGFAADASP